MVPHSPTRNAVLRYLRALSHCDLTKLIYEIGAAKTQRQKRRERSHLVIGEATSESEGGWVVDLFALNDPAYPREAQLEGGDMCQLTECYCGSRLRSYAKHMVCPVCGEAVYGT